MDNHGAPEWAAAIATLLAVLVAFWTPTRIGNIDQTKRTEAARRLAELVMTAINASLGPRYINGSSTGVTDTSVKYLRLPDIIAKMDAIAPEYFGNVEFLEAFVRLTSIARSVRDLEGDTGSPKWLTIDEAAKRLNELPDLRDQAAAQFALIERFSSRGRRRSRSHAAKDYHAPPR